MAETQNSQTGQEPQVELRTTRLAVSPDPWFKLFLSNLKEFLTERPGKARPGGGSGAFQSERFGSSLRENFKECMRPLPPSARRAANSDLLVSAKPWFAAFWQNIHDTISPPKLPPLELTCQPVEVPEIWSKNEQFTRTQALSFAIHVLVAVLIILPLLPFIMSPPAQTNNLGVTQINLSPYLPKLKMGNQRAGGGGGGGNHEVIPASKGRLPKFAMNQFTPPVVKPLPKPKLPVAATVMVPPNIHMPDPNVPNYGDPLAKILTASNGSGSQGGIGSGSGGGVGSGNGRGVGPGSEYGTGGGPPEAGQNGYGYPDCLYCPVPQFSDAAFKLKIQGDVVLSIIVGADGRAYDIHVAKGLGYGLDESAVKEVGSVWRFKPSIGPDGKPAAVHMLVDVDFNIY